MMFSDESESTIPINSKPGRPESSKGYDPSAQKRVMVACIERAWIRYYNNRLIVVKTAFEFMAAMGNQITTYAEFNKLIATSDSVIVIINGNHGNPLAGHSYFLTKGKYHELTMNTASALNLAKKRGNKTYYNSARTFTHTDKKGTKELVYAVIAHRQRIIKDRSFFEKYSYLINKGVVFSITNEFKQYFIKSFEDERAKFCIQPYSYGIGYNCNTFVFNVLREMFFRKIKGSVALSQRQVRCCIF